jgi:hypothetical protein
MRPLNVAPPRKVMAIIVQSRVFNRSAEKLAALKPCPFAGRVTADQVKIAPGELLDIWPPSITDGMLGHLLGQLTAALRKV